MKNPIKAVVSLFQRPPAHQVAQRQLKELEHSMLSHQASAEYHAKMVEYCQEGMTRLAMFRQVSHG